MGGWGGNKAGVRPHPIPEIPYCGMLDQDMGGGGGYFQPEIWLNPFIKIMTGLSVNVLSGKQLVTSIPIMNIIPALERKILGDRSWSENDFDNRIFCMVWLRLGWWGLGGGYNLQDLDDLQQYFDHQDDPDVHDRVLHLRLTWLDECDILQNLTGSVPHRTAFTPLSAWYPKIYPPVYWALRRFSFYSTWATTFSFRCALLVHFVGHGMSSPWGSLGT